ncbi:FxLD family lanthipeptide [Streptosporangium sp. NPDC002524]|uniref:FxLD family lanthipeptide n=1 Tax=Streptosporangium sp. NPDC002524 TaxID=3154537 RepID=UPI003326F847
MTATTLSLPAPDLFALDLRVIVDVGSGSPVAPCNTEDGCAPTCASSCTSN